MCNRNPCKSECVCVCVQGSRRCSLGAGPAPPPHALIFCESVRTLKVMYAHITGIPIIKDSWLLACVSAHRLLPFGEHQVKGAQGSQGHQAFQGLCIHLAGPPAFQQNFGRLVQHAGGCSGCVYVTQYLHVPLGTCKNCCIHISPTHLAISICLPLPFTETPAGFLPGNPTSHLLLMCPSVLGTSHRCCDLPACWITPPHQEVAKHMIV